MIGLVLLGLLGVTASAFVLGNVFDTDDDTPPAGDGDESQDLIDNALDLLDIGDGSDDGEEPGETPVPDEEEPPALTRDGDTLFGTDGNDIIGSDELEAAGAAQQIDLLGGDDIFNGRGDSVRVAEVNGGDGDDALTITQGDSDTLNGEAGNDTLSARNGVSAYGGPGDDTILYDHGNGIGNYATNMIDGGGGNDTILLREEIGTDNLFDNTPARVTGGPGTDAITFELINDVDDPEDNPLSVGDEGEDPSLITIEDFTPGEDSLTLDISDFTEDGEFTYLGADLVEEEDGQYALTLSLLAQGATQPFSTTVNIRSAADLTLDDIEITGTAPEGVNTGPFDVANNTLSGTDGADLITPNDVASGVFSIEGGAGNDTIFDREARIFGEAGDDFIIARNPFIVDGGEGNDRIIVDRSGNEVSDLSIVDGGDGDDDILYLNDLDYFTKDYGGTWLSGGAGADEFTIKLAGPIGEFVGFDLLREDSSTIVDIRDFTPGEDSLTLDLRDIDPATEIRGIELRDGADPLEKDLVILLTTEDGTEWERIVEVVLTSPAADLLDEVNILLPE